jgi:hypothetical protein
MTKHQMHWHWKNLENKALVREEEFMKTTWLELKYKV